VAGAVREGKELPYPALNAIVRRAGVDAGTPERLVEQRLAPYATEILSWLYAQFVQQCRQRRWCPALIFMPMVPEMTYESRSIELRLAVEGGFVPLDLMSVYDGADRNALWIAEWDAHPNAAAHKLMADRLYELIARNQAGTCLELEQATGPRQAAAR
jgi:hypothetical protein